MLRASTLSLLLLLLPACSAVTVDRYADFSPKFDPQTFFSGQLSAHGVVKNRGGQVIRTFNADIQAQWVDDVGTLVEDFIFDDGEIQQRVWTLTPTGDGMYRGTAGDVVGAGLLKVAGNSLFLQYTLRIPYRDSTVDVKVDDRMYLISHDVLINESQMTKFGIRVGSIDLTIIRHDTSGSHNNEGVQYDYRTNRPLVDSGR
jgi:hypothetical protein